MMETLKVLTLPTLLHPPTSLVAFSSSSSFFRIWSWSYWQALVCCTFGNAVLTISKEFCPRQLDGNGRGDPKWASKSNTDFGHLRSTYKDLFPKLWLKISQFMLRISLNSSTFPHWLRLNQINDICRSAALCVPTMSRGHVSVCLCLCLCLSMCQGQLCASDNSPKYF